MKRIICGEKYEAALEIQPDDHKALYNWGDALIAQAGTKSQKEAKQLLDLANQKLAAARALAPEVYPVEEDIPEVKPNKGSTVRRRKKKKAS